MRVPFADLSRWGPGLRSEVDAAVARVLDRGWFVLGEEGRSFEHEFAAALGAGDAVAVGSGTDAIELALRALEIGPGDEVITQANTCIPTVAGIERAGATPALCDVDPLTGMIDVASAERALTPRTRALVPVHLYGQCADMAAVLELGRRHELPVVEDCAQAHLARVGERMVGTIGTLGAFSFYPTKNLGALGDGGAVVTDDPGLADRVRLARQYGQAQRYEHVSRGVNSRLDELQAAILRAKLPHLAAANRRRAEIGARYDEALSGLPLNRLERLPETTEVFHLYVVRTPERDRVQAALAERGVQTLIHYPHPVHRHPGYANLNRPGIELAAAERLAGEVLSLPLFPELTDDEVEHVAVSLAEVARGG